MVSFSSAVPVHDPTRRLGLHVDKLISGLTNANRYVLASGRVLPVQDFPRHQADIDYQKLKDMHFTVSLRERQ